MSQDQLESSDLNALIIARRGRQEMLKALFGEKEQSKTPHIDPSGTIKGGGGKPMEFTPAAFDMLFPGKQKEDSIN